MVSFLSVAPSSDDPERGDSVSFSFKFCSVQEAVAVEALREGFWRCVGAVFMIEKQQSGCKCKSNPGRDGATIYDDGEVAHEKLAPGSLGNNPPSSDRIHWHNRRWHDKQMPVRSLSQPKVPSRWTLKGPRCDRLTDRKLRLTVELPLIVCRTSTSRTKHICLSDHLSVLLEQLWSGF